MSCNFRRTLKLSDWARRNGVCFQTAWRWWKDGNLPVPVQQLATGTILVRDESWIESSENQEVVVYARVSSHDQKKDLDAQVARLTCFATSKKFLVSQVVTEIGSGLNGSRPKLLKLLNDKKKRCILVEHRDRLTRFGFEYIDALMRSSGRVVLIAEPGELKDDLVQDMMDVLTSFCARLYGKRSAKNKAKKAFAALEEKNALHH